MRIISQDRMTDTPFDGAVIYIDKTTDKQICVIVHVPDEAFTIGTYNSIEDALRVIELIRDCFIYGGTYFVMPKSDMVSRCYEKEGKQE